MCRRSGRGQKRAQDPSLLKHTWHLSPKETQTALVLCCLRMEWFLEAGLTLSGLHSTESHPSHTGVRALTQVHGVLPAPLERCLPAPEPSREGTGCLHLCPVPGEVSSSFSAAAVSTSMSTKHAKGQTNVVCDFTGFHSSFSLQKDFFISTWKADWSYRTHHGSCFFLCVVFMSTLLPSPSFWYILIII